MRPQPPGLVRRRQPLVIAEIKKDVGGLADQKLAGFQDRRRERRRRRLSLQHGKQLVAPAAAAPRDVDIVGARLFQSETDELAAPLDLRPVVKLVLHATLHRGFYNRPMTNSL